MSYNVILVPTGMSANPTGEGLSPTRLSSSTLKHQLQVVGPRVTYNLSRLAINWRFEFDQTFCGFDRLLEWLIVNSAKQFAS